MTHDELMGGWAASGRPTSARCGTAKTALLLWWLFGRFHPTGSSTASYRQTEEPSVI